MYHNQQNTHVYNDRRIAGANVESQNIVLYASPFLIRPTIIQPKAVMIVPVQPCYTKYQMPTIPRFIVRTAASKVVARPIIHVSPIHIMPAIIPSPSTTSNNSSEQKNSALRSAIAQGQINAKILASLDIKDMYELLIYSELADRSSANIEETGLDNSCELLENIIGVDHNELHKYDKMSDSDAHINRRDIYTRLNPDSRWLELIPRLDHLTNKLLVEDLVKIDIPLTEAEIASRLAEMICFNSVKMYGMASNYLSGTISAQYHEKAIGSCMITYDCFCSSLYNITHNRLSIENIRSYISNVVHAVNVNLYDYPACFDLLYQQVIFLFSCRKLSKHSRTTSFLINLYSINIITCLYAFKMISIGDFVEHVIDTVGAESNGVILYKNFIFARDHSKTIFSKYACEFDTLCPNWRNTQYTMYQATRISNSSRGRTIQKFKSKVRQSEEIGSRLWAGLKHRGSPLEKEYTMTGVCRAPNQ